LLNVSTISIGKSLGIEILNIFNSILFYENLVDKTIGFFGEQRTHDLIQ